MITIQEDEILDRGIAAINRAKELNKPILYSEVRKLNTINPLSFFQLGKDKYFGERFFWKDPKDELILVGLGCAAHIQSEQTDNRFLFVEKEWVSCLQDAFIYNPYKEIGIGPIVFGGFTFDPAKEKTSLWSKYTDSMFNLPKYLITINRGQVFLTTNIICSPEDNESIIQNEINDQNQLIFTESSADRLQQGKLLKTEEILPNEWKDAVRKIVGELADGPLKKVVLARELRLLFDKPIEVEKVLSNLNEQQHESFIFAMESDGDCFVGASPERLVKKQGNEILSTCLAGSISRGVTEQEDRLLGEELLNDQKNLVEHQYVVDMIKEALEEFCNEIILPDQPQLMKIRDIQHLYTPVIGKCHETTSLLQLVERLHPTPALGGLPKKEAVEKIRTVEALDRGFYAAPLGWMDYKGNGEFAVAIRSGLIQGKEASLFAGCGVVADSDPESEYLETSLKFRPMLRALGGN